MKIQCLILLILTVFVCPSKAADPLFAIALNNSSAVQYCNAPVFVAEGLTIEGTFTIKGMKVSFSEGYMPGEDELAYTGSAGNIVGTWVPQQGYILLKGDDNTTITNYRDAIRSVTYKNNRAVPTLGTRKITVTLEDADYLPASGHFYRFISKVAVRWSDAEIESKSDAMMYFGLRGYLATITSQAENDFIKLKTTGVGWIGASDSLTEGEWRWVTGPEGLEDNDKGRLFWRGKGVEAKVNPSVYGPVRDAFGTEAYHNWNRWNTQYLPTLPLATWEPNQSGDEDYAHITVFPTNPNDSYKWNDLPNTGGNGDYSSKGYLIEYGGLPGEPTLNLTATLDLQVNTVVFKTGVIDPVCAGTPVVLNQPDLFTTPATYVWTPATSLSNPSAANPAATPAVSTLYRVTGTRGACRADAEYAVTVNPNPVVNLGNDTTICNPGTLSLNAGNGYKDYLWSTGASTPVIVVNSEGSYSVNITDHKGCKTSDQIKVSFTNKPKIDFTGLDTLVCGQKTAVLDISADKGDLTVQRLGDGFVFNGTGVAVPDFGSYDFLIKATDRFSCYSDSVIGFGFHKTPSVDFSIDSTKCYGYNLDVKYSGDASIASSDFTWVFGGDTIKQGIGIDAYLVPLGVNRATRDLTLTVTDQGCANEKTLRDIKVIPNLQISVTDRVGCEPFTTQFIAQNTETVTYAWDFGDGSVSSGLTADPMHTYQHDGFYPVHLRVTTDKGCTNEIVSDSMVYVAPVPTAGFTAFPASCLGQGDHSIWYAGTGNERDRYIWDLHAFEPDEIIQNPAETRGPFSFNLKHKPQAGIGIKVISEYGCRSDSATVLVKRKPGFSVSPSAVEGCVPFEPALSGIINDPADKVDFSWDFGNGTSASGAQVVPRYEQPDKKYTISLSALSSVTGCSDTLVSADLLRTYPKPLAAFTLDNAVVYNDKPDVNFINQSEGATTWLWDFGDGKSSVLRDPSYHFMKMGHQQVLLEVTNDNQCTDTVSHRVLVAFDRLFPPTGFSPNAPDVADREFKLTSEGIAAEGYHFTVLSRWNDLIYEVKDEIRGWDGRMKNESLAPAGTYIWILNFTDFLGRRHRQTGTVTLVY